MKSKRMLSLFMAALGSVSTSMAAKKSVNHKQRKTYNSSAVRKAKKKIKRNPVSHFTISNGLKNSEKSQRVSTSKGSSKKQRNGVSLSESDKGKNAESKQGVRVLNSSSQKNDDQSTWEKMSDVEKGLTIGGPSFVTVAGGTAVLLKRARDLKCVEKTKNICSKDANQNNVRTRTQNGFAPYRVEVYNGEKSFKSQYGGKLLKLKEVDFLLVKDPDSNGFRLFYKDCKAGKSSLPEEISNLQNVYGSFSQDNDGVSLAQAQEKIDKFVHKIAKEEVWFGREELAKTLKDQIPSEIGGSGVEW